MPIARGKNRQLPSGKLGQVTIEHMNHTVAAKHGEVSARKEIVLDIDHDQGVACVQPDFLPAWFSLGGGQVHACSSSRLRVSDKVSRLPALGQGLASLAT